jgi:hypothetical protein
MRRCMVGLRQGGERHVQVNFPGGKPSMSHFQACWSDAAGKAYCEVRIETGRTHQIRVHAQAHRPSGGGRRQVRRRNRQQASLREQAGLKRLFLHAASAWSSRWTAGAAAIPAECAAGTGAGGGAGSPAWLTPHRRCGRR